MVYAFEIKCDLNRIKGYLREGKGHLGLGDYESAIRLFQKVKSLQPESTAADLEVNYNI